MVLILRAGDRIAVPWKNGGGVTREVAVHPPGSDLAGFDWRVSIAEVRAPGPFSTFPGVDRSLAVLEGALSLRIAGRAPLMLAADTPPAHFPGDVPVSAEPFGGAVTDLNVMTRRARYQARIGRALLPGPADLPPGAATTLLVALAPLTLECGEGRYPLERLDAALLEGAGACAVRSVRSSGDVWLIELLTRMRQRPSHLDQSSGVRAGRLRAPPSKKESPA